MKIEQAPFGVAASGLGRRFGTGVLWNLVASVCNQGSTLAVSVAAARLLDRNTFGEYVILQTTLIALATLAQVASGYTATKYLAEYREVDKAKASRILGLCAAVSLVMSVLAAGLLLVLSPLMAEKILHDPHLTLPLRLAAGILLFTVLNGFQMGALAGFEAYRALGLAGAVAGGSYFVLGVAGVRLGSLEGLILGLTGAGVIQWLVLRGMLQKAQRESGVRVDWRNAADERSVFGQFALPAALSGMFSMVALWFANAVLVRSQGGLAEIALYGAANNVRIVVLFVPLVINGVGLSLLNRERGRQGLNRYWDVFRINLGLSALAIVIVGGAFALLGPWLLQIFGPLYVAGYPVLLILLASTVPEGLAVAIYQIFQSRGRLWLSIVLVSIPRDGSILLLAILLAPGHGAQGLAIAYAAGWAIALLAVVILARLSLKAGAKIQLTPGGLPA